MFTPQEKAVVDDWLERLEEVGRQITQATESLSYSARTMQEAASTMSSAATHQREAAGTMYMSRQ